MKSNSLVALIAPAYEIWIEKKLLNYGANNLSWFWITPSKYDNFSNICQIIINLNLPSIFIKSQKKLLNSPYFFLIF